MKCRAVLCFLGSALPLCTAMLVCGYGGEGGIVEVALTRLAHCLLLSCGEFKTCSKNVKVSLLSKLLVFILVLDCVFVHIGILRSYRFSNLYVTFD